MEETGRKQLAEILARGYRQREREVLLSELGVEPEECTLGAQTPDEVAWRIVRWFEDRDRLEELDRATRVGWFRKRLRQISLASLASVPLVLVLLFGFNLFDAQARLCRLRLGQARLADACGAWGLGGAPTKQERIAWESREQGSCAALRLHLSQFPEGAYRQVAESRLAARQIERQETWTPREHPLEVHASRDVAPMRDRAAAEAAARARAQVEAERLCKNFAAPGQNRLRSARIDKARMQCERLAGGQVCSLDAEALCALDQRGETVRESCPESGAP